VIVYFSPRIWGDKGGGYSERLFQNLLPVVLRTHTDTTEDGSVRMLLNSNMVPLVSRTHIDIGRWLLWVAINAIRLTFLEDI
jgi:hypothetical protein